MRLKLNDEQIVWLEINNLNLVDLCAYKWLHNKKSRGKSILVSHADFRTWFANVAKGQKTISTRNAPRAFERLHEAGLINLKKRGFGLFEVTVFSFDFALGLISHDTPQTASDEKRQDQDSEGTKNKFDLKSRVFQQQLITVKQLLAKIGVNFRLEKDWWEIASYDLEEIEATVEYFQFKEAKHPGSIYNPAGWVRQALKFKYYLDFDSRNPIYERFVNFFSRCDFWDNPASA